MTTKAARRQSDDPTEFYPTPRPLTLALLHALGEALEGEYVLEPCAGDGAIVRELEAFGLRVTATDLNPRAPQRGLFDTEEPKPIASRADATDPAFWKDRSITTDFVITNPPFSLGNIIRSFARSEGLKLALLLRVSMLEPVEDRADWLRDDPPSDLILLPRVSFDGNGSDQATTVWFVWRNNQPNPQQATKFHVFSRADLAQLERVA